MTLGLLGNRGAAVSDTGVANSLADGLSTAPASVSPAEETGGGDALEGTEFVSSFSGGGGGAISTALAPSAETEFEMSPGSFGKAASAVTGLSSSLTFSVSLPANGSSVVSLQPASGSVAASSPLSSGLSSDFSSRLLPSLTLNRTRVLRSSLMPSASSAS